MPTTLLPSGNHLAYRVLGDDDAAAAADLLAEMDAGHPAAADRIADESGLGDLTDEDLLVLAGRYGYAAI